MFFEEKDFENYNVDIKNNFSAIYFLLNNDEVIYIGKGINIYNRIKFHIKDENKIFNKIKYKKCNAEELNFLENYYILKYQPKKNIMPSTEIKSLNVAISFLIKQKIDFYEIINYFKKNEITVYKFHNSQFISKEHYENIKLYFGLKK